MNKKISANEFRESLDRHASDLKANPWLAQSIIASETEGGAKVKRKWTTSVVLALAMILTLGTVAYGVTSWYRAVSWKGEEQDAGEMSYIEMPEEKVTLTNKMIEYVYSRPDEETVAAWFEDGREMDPWNNMIRPKTKRFRCVEDFQEYMSGVPSMTAPVWYPEGEYESFLAEVYLICNDSGEYELLESGEEGPIHYNHYRLDDADAVPFEYSVSITLKDGRSYTIQSSLATNEPKYAAYLAEGETVETINVKGMDEALLFHNRKPEDCDIIMRRKLEKPVSWKQVASVVDGKERQSGTMDEEYIYIWSWEAKKDPYKLMKFFNGDDGE